MREERLIPHLQKWWDIVIPLVTVILLTIIRTDVELVELNVCYFVTVVFLLSFINHFVTCIHAFLISVVVDLPI